MKHTTALHLHFIIAKHTTPLHLYFSVFRETYYSIALVLFVFRETYYSIAPVLFCLFLAKYNYTYIFILFSRNILQHCTCILYTFRFLMQIETTIGQTSSRLATQELTLVVRTGEVMGVRLC